MSTLYTVTFAGGRQTGLCYAVDSNDAGDYMERHIGRDNGPLLIAPASENDEAWFKSMGGGYIHRTPAARKEDEEDGQN